MNSTATLTAAAVLAAGLVGAGILLRPASNEAAIDARIEAATRPLSSRLEKLEEETARLSREREAALRQGAEALSTALDARRDLDRLRERTDDLLSALSSGGGATPAGVKAARGGALASGPGSGSAGDGASAAPVAGDPASPAVMAGGPGPGGSAGSAGTPQQIEQVRAAMDLIRKEEAEQQRAQWEQQRKRMQAKRLASFTERLGLSPSQAERVQAIWDETQARREQAFSGMHDGTMTPVEMKETMVQTRVDEERRLQETLSPQQFEEYQKLQKESPQPVMMGATFEAGGAGVGAIMRDAVIVAPAGAAPAGAGAAPAGGK